MGNTVFGWRQRPPQFSLALRQWRTEAPDRSKLMTEVSENGKRTMRVHKLAYVLAGAIGAQIALAQPGSAFECPEPQAQDARGVIPESSQEIARVGALLRTGDVDNRIEVIARALKQKYPTADQTELTNFMVTAYCPIIAADQGLDESEKAERLDMSSEEIWQVYSELGL
jgi:hypothetical protein